MPPPRVLPDDGDAAGDELPSRDAAVAAALAGVEAATRDGRASMARAPVDVGDQADADAGDAPAAGAAAGLAALSALSLTPDELELSPGKRKRGPTALGDAPPRYKTQPLGAIAPRTLVSNALKASTVRGAAFACRSARARARRAAAAARQR